MNLASTRPNRRLWSLCLVWGSLLVPGAGLAEEVPPAPIRSPLEPAAALAQFKLAPGLRIELVAAEPEVIDPISLAFDEQGVLWVVEMTDYPNGPTADEPPRSRIRRLQDRDGDGRYETAQVFVDKLLFATGLQPWQGGVIVTLAGEVAYFRDNDGDGVADLRETWFRGFLQENPQLRANHPRFGLDNQIYVANGLRGGTIVANAQKWGREPPALPITGFDFRFNPRNGEHAAVSGMGQFGLSFDEFGNRFVCTNRNPCRHIVLEDRYLKRNPFLGVRDVAADVSPAGGDSSVYPLSSAWTTSTLHAGQFTAACGVTIYRGTALPAEYRGNSFTCEPTGSLVHRDVLEPRGATFGSHPGREKAEFLATADSWFRPVDLADGPDGALYVADMYRAVIEHPQWVPDELKNRRDLNDGNDRGRIYRIVTADAPAAPLPRPNLAEASPAELVQALDHPNTWQRQTAARLIYERQLKEAVPALEQLAGAARHPAARVQALWTLDGLGALTAEVVARAFADPSPRVREQAALLSERSLKESGELAAKLIALANDTDPRVRFQVALSLGELPTSEESVKALAAIAWQGTDDEWTRRACLSSVAEQAPHFLAALLAAPGSSERAANAGGLLLLKETAEVIAARRDPGEIRSAVSSAAAWHQGQADQIATADRVRLRIVAGLGQGLARRGGSLTGLLTTDGKLPLELSDVFASAVRVSADPQAVLADRQEALDVLRYAGFPVAGELLLRLAREESTLPVQLKALEVLGSFSDAEIGPLLVDGFRSRTPSVRRAILPSLLRNPARIGLLFDEIATRRIAISELDPAQVRALTTHPDTALRERANMLLAAALPADRRQVLETYRPALELKADAGRGKIIFEKNCSTCHKIGTLGVDVGPDIADSRTKTPAQLLNDILHPNQAIDNNYVSYTVLTHAGLPLTGIITAETGASMTLRQPENKTLILLRQDIEELRSNGISLMPEGLEKNISVPQMADLISFIKNWRYLDGQVPLGEPAKAIP